MTNAIFGTAGPRGGAVRRKRAAAAGLIVALCALRWAAAAGPAPALVTPLIVDLELKASGNNYDDLCFWRDPADVDNSLVFVTSKSGPFVEVFRLATGQLLSRITGFVSPNNCDVTGDLLVTTDSHTGHKVLVHHIPDFSVVAVLNQNFTNAQGVAVLHEGGRDLAFITDQDQGNVHVYDLATFQLVRVFPTGFQTHEGVVADDLYDRVYISDAPSSLVRAFSATGTLLGEFGHPDIGDQAEGITMYRCGTGGWIVVSDQRQTAGGPSEYEVYDRTSFAHVGTFTLKNANGDLTNATDGVDVFQVSTSRFPAGVFGACDNCVGPSADDVDLVGWDRVATSLGLAVCPDGRPLTCGNGIVDRFEQCDGTNTVACPGRCQADCLCGAAPPRCGDGIVNRPGEQCDGASAPSCPGACQADCTCAPRCGDGLVNQATELCDGAADAACPGRCRTACACSDPSLLVTLEPVADTYIEQGTQAGWDHGAAPSLAARAKPIDVSYLKFDLSRVAGPIRAATLTLFATRAATSGGVVYPVRDTSWREGDRIGTTASSAAGTGLKWADVDTNRDGKLDARDTSPCVPDYSRPLVTMGSVKASKAYALNVTPAFQAGRGLYTLAISGKSKTTYLAAFASRETANPTLRPQLRLEGPGCVVAADCDDGNGCTDDLCAPAGGCVHTANRAACEDGNRCTTADTCAAGVCVRGSPASCDDGNPCTDDACVPAEGCVHSPNTSPCDDGNVCTTADTCAGGRCVGGPAATCDDGDVCTDDACRLGVGCVHSPNTEPCDDRNPCTVFDTCAAGRCTSGQAGGCDDHNPCTDDTCDPARGCLHTPNTAPCDDGDGCTTADTCAAGTCVGGPPASCDDGNGCTADSCDPAQGCLHVPSTAPCDDGDPCTTGDRCAGGTCASGVSACDDGNPCTDDACDQGGGCTHTMNGGPCTDGDACTTDDTCAGGVCVGGTGPTCDDGNPCTDDGCDPGSGCVYLGNTDPCDDDDACTTDDACAGGVCLGGPAPACDDADVCTDDACDPDAGCIHVLNSAPCSDGSACTTTDTCAGGVCHAGPARTCDDGNACTDEACDPARGCVYEASTAPCDDGNACTTADRCTESACVGDPVRCDDGNVCTTDGCNPVSGCEHTANSAPCTDGNPCTVGDTCTAGLCQGGPSCGDDVVQAGCGETCDGTSHGSCPGGCIPPGQAGACTCAPVPRCGDNQVNQASEECDGTASGACPGACRFDCTCPAPVGTVEADVYVDSINHALNFGTRTLISVDAGPTALQTFLRVRVTGVGTWRVTSARLRLQVASSANAQSVTGGSIHGISACGWDERTLTWDTRPAIDGAALATLGAVALGQVVDLDVTSAITGDGVYCFAIESPSTDGVDYNSREGAGTRPAFLVSAQP